MSINKVVISSNIRREAVFIDPSVSAAEPAFNTETKTQSSTTNVLAEGASGRSILKRIYGR